MFLINVSVNTRTAKEAHVAIPTSLLTWHKRLAHVSLPIIMKTLSTCNVHFNEK